jgi:hypothetical protein|tara:strand:- start:7810 stop:8265 length:456 start_codon:yes stop_codon:yes gene_type:complete
MKIWTIIIVMLSVNISNGQNIEKIRRLYLQSSNNYSKLDSLNYSLSNYKKTNNLMSAYYGVNLILKSKYLKNPFKKIEYFEKGREILENAIIKEPDNIELIFLRYTVQKKTPSILMYKKDIEEDYQFIKSELDSTKDQRLKKYISQTLQKL